MSFFFWSLAFVTVFFLEWTAGRFFSFAGVSVPLVIFLTAILFWRHDLLARLYFGIFLGIMADGLSSYPAGTHLVLFVALALLIEILQKFFSETDSSLVKAICLASAVFIIINFTNPIASLLGVGKGLGISFWQSFNLGVFWASIFWSVILPAVFISAEKVFAK